MVFVCAVLFALSSFGSIVCSSHSARWKFMYSIASVAAAAAAEQYYALATLPITRARAVLKTCPLGGLPLASAI